MNYKTILVTGGAGFVGSNICIKLKKYYPNIQVIALDNLYRKGSELNLPRLKKYGIAFVHGDVRKRKDVNIASVDLLIECCAEPSVMAGVTSSPEYVLDTNLMGAINCFELARRHHADVIFLSTSRVYPVECLNNLPYIEKETRFDFANKEGIAEDFPLEGHRTFYGATKLSAELLLQEYVHTYGIKGIIDRFGVIAGPWQMGKVDQGFVALWVAHHVFGKPLAYIGFGGIGKQVRDVLHIDDLFDLVHKQITHMEQFSGEVYNVGGGRDNSVSLYELTRLCKEITSISVAMSEVKKTRLGDVRIYITDNAKVTTACGWKPKHTIHHVVEDTCRWIRIHKRMLEHVLE